MIHMTLFEHNLCRLYLYYPLEPNDISVMLRLSLDENAGHFLWPAEFEKVANPDFENLKHLQNPGHLPLTVASILNDYMQARICR